MAKNSIRDYSATNSANTDIQSIDISEGCSPAGINNAIREVMADLKDVSTGAVALESPAFDSASLTGDLTFGDNDKAIFGAGSDLQIYHNPATGSYIEDAGAGNLILKGTSVVIDDSSGARMATFADGGAVTLNHGSNASARLATTSTGVDVTGGLNTTGSVGIGTSSPARELDVVGDIGYNGQIKPTDTGANGTATNPSICVGYDFDTGFFRAAANTIGVTTGGTERMRIDSGGNVVIAKTTTSNTVQGITLGVDGQLNCVIQNAGGASQAIFINRQDATGNAILFRYQNSTIGSIAINASSTSYNTSSDYRLKENVTADWDATTRLKQLNPVRFNFIADADTTVDGFLAHEVQDIVPEAISGTKDGMMDEEYTVSAATGDIYTPAVEATYDEDGVELTAAVDEVIHSADVERPEELAEGQQWRETTAAVMGTRSVPNYQGIDQSKLVPLLVKTIQELEARITALEAN